MELLIENIEKITNFFGYTPNFHDSEIEKINMEKEGPNIDFCIYVFENSSELDKNGALKISKACRVVIRFVKVMEMELKDFNSQNVLYDLTFSKINNGIKTVINSSYGLNGYIISSKVSVISLDSII